VNLTVDITDELVEQIARRVAEINGQSSGESPEPRAGRWLRGAESIANYVDAKPSRIYKLATCTPPRIPVERDGSALIAHTDRLDRWVEEGGGISP
jgi:hypothetical protein